MTSNHHDRVPPPGADDHVLAEWLATVAGERLLEVRAEGLEGRELKDAGDRAAHELLMTLLATHRPDDAVLSEEGRDDLIIVDRQKHADQWQNLCHRRYEEYLDKEELLPWLEAGAELDAVIHMGAISATIERDWNRLLEDNIRYSQGLWQWCADNGVPFLYASSAATYGGGENGYDDAGIENLRPLNAYGYSKGVFEAMARMYNVNPNRHCVALRIGWVARNLAEVEAADIWLQANYWDDARLIGQVQAALGD